MTQIQFEERVPLSSYSTFGIGGPARFFVEVSTVEALVEAIRSAHLNNLPFFVLGKGSNCLFDDAGFDGLVILNKIAFCEHREEEVYVGAGYSFALLGVQTARKGFSGLEFASGIPGTVGGAIYMNAGAGGSETCSVLKEVTIVSETAEVQIIPREELAFSYRTSPFQALQIAIAAARFALKPSLKARQTQLSLVEYRTRTQPYKDKSAGCVFRNPLGRSAGALIEACGLKGARMGAAEISQTHANFIVNMGGATANDVLSLVSSVQNRVKEQTGIDLEMEIRYIASV